jgi:hypothetical protein
VFIGNPDLEMSALDNYDLRLDYTPYEGGLVSLSWFHKDIEDPIEYVQRLAGFNFTTPVNYPEGTLGGVELEVRQDLGQLLGRARRAVRGPQRDVHRLIEVSCPPTIRRFSLPEDQRADDDARHDERARVPVQPVPHVRPRGAGTQFGSSTRSRATRCRGRGQAQGNFVPSIYAKPVRHAQLQRVRRSWAST